MQSWVDRVNEATDKALAYEGPDRELLLGWFETYVALISLHKGGPGQDHLAPWATPTRRSCTKCQVLTAASRRVVDRLGGDGALRDDVDAVQICRLVGGVATVADQADARRRRRPPAARGRRRRHAALTGPARRPATPGR